MVGLSYVHMHQHKLRQSTSHATPDAHKKAERRTTEAWERETLNVNVNSQFGQNQNWPAVKRDSKIRPHIYVTSFPANCLPSFSRSSSSSLISMASGGIYATVPTWIPKYTVLRRIYCREGLQVPGWSSRGSRSLLWQCQNQRAEKERSSMESSTLGQVA